jgi:RNA polymerase sigma factor (sigma-70 family)
MNDSQGAFERIIEPLRERMIRSIWRVVGNAQDADDAMQNALLSLWKHWQRIVAHPTADALVLKICIDAAYDVRRRRWRAYRFEQLHSSNDEPADPAGSPAEKLIRNETYSVVRNAIDGLSRQQAVAMLMRVLEELPYNEIAAAMGCTEATARKHVSRGREHLRIALAHLKSNHTTRSQS